MKYEMPTTLSELSAMLHHKDDTVFLCAGSTDLMLHLKQKSYHEYGLIDLTHVKEMKKIDRKGNILHIGAAVTMSELEQSELVKACIPALGVAAGMVGSAQIRNLATLGGNTANASQSADTLTALMAYGADAVLLGADNQTRRVKVEDLIIGLGKHHIGCREAITEFLIPCDDSISFFSKVGSRKSVTISKLNGCLKASRKGNRINDVQIYLGAIGPKPVKASYIEEVLEGKAVDQIEEKILKAAIDQQIEVCIGDRPSKHYKKSAAFGIVHDLLEGFKAEISEAL